jgi:3-oxoacyl-[acyl-carrier protein] reductase
MAVARAAGVVEPGSLAGKVALVTGASRGIGEAIAKSLAEAGATVVGTATSDSGAEKITARFGGDLKGTGMKLNVGDQADVDKVLKAVAAEYGGVDILVNNAGITKDGLMMMMKPDAWDDVISTNLNSVFKMSKGVLRPMTKKRWGRIISISSVVGSMGNGGQTNYAAAKAGMDGFTRALAREVASRGITVNSVAPGFIKSDMTDQLKDEWKDKLMESVPLGRLGTPKEVADAVLFLASPMADYVTGQILHVNGGMYM